MLLSEALRALMTAVPVAMACRRPELEMVRTSGRSEVHATAAYLCERIGKNLSIDELREPLERLRAAGVTLVVTVDCGISGAPEVAYAAGIGLDIVVTDHHAVSAELPLAVAVVNPRRHEGAEADGCLAGVGIAAGAHIASLFDHIDLDANILIAHDPFPGVEFVDGVQVPSELPGLGVAPG